MKDYIPRMLDEELKTKMQVFGGILIVGPKWCGKSTTAKRYVKSVLELQDPKTRASNLEMASVRPDLLLNGEKPRLIDEWQDAPQLWDAVRYEVDNSGLRNQFVLTGSVTPRKEEPSHTGTGRIARLTMRPLSLYESNDSTGEVSLSELFNSVESINAISDKELEDIAFLCTRGGWPASVGVDAKSASLIAREYLESLIHVDIKKVDKVERNPERMRAILRSLSRNICTSANLSTIKEDIAYNESKISEKTISDYINVLERLYVVDNVTAWSPKLRSKTDIRNSPKRCLVDPSIVVASLRATESDLLNDARTLGFVFESLCIRDLKIYTQSLDGDVFFYRDKTDLECDAVIHLHDGRWAAVEVKLGSQEGIDEGAKNLLKLVDRVNTDKMNLPSFLMILTAGKLAYRREDGVFVVPITTLKN